MPQSIPKQRKLRDGKKAKNSIPRLAERKGSHRSGKGKNWVKRYELDPECSYFPMSSTHLVMKGAREENYLFTVRLGADIVITSDGSGLLQTVITNNPSQGQNWSNYASVFDEYRVLMAKAEFDPLWATGGSTQTFWAPIASVIDRSDSTVLTSYGLAERYSSHKKTPGQKKFHQSVNMSSVDDSGFVSTASPAANAWIKFYSSGNSLSLTLGRVNLTLLVQFRGVGIN